MDNMRHDENCFSGHQPSDTPIDVMAIKARNLTIHLSVHGFPWGFFLRKNQLTANDKYIPPAFLELTNVKLHLQLKNTICLRRGMN